MSRQNVQTQSTAGQQTDLLFGLLHVGPKLLHEFVNNSRAGLDSINALVESAKVNGDYKTMTDAGLSIVHGIKGSASLFDLTLYIHIAHGLEDKLRRMQVAGEADLKTVLAGLEAQISRLSRALDETAALLEPLSWFQNFADTHISRTRAFLTGAALLVEEMSRVHQVNAALHYTHFDLERIPAVYSQTIVDVLTQLLRNAVAHGIEPPGERQEAGKPVRGLIYLASRHSSKYYRFSVQDDGRGLNPADLKAAVAASETFSPMATGAMTTAELAAFLFEPGFTTSKSPSHSAGCGMGLNLVVQKLSALEGRLEFVFTRGKGCRFEFSLPVPKALLTEQVVSHETKAFENE